MKLIDKELIYLIKKDCQRYYPHRGGGNKKLTINILKNIILPINHCMVYGIWLRLSSRKNLFYYLAKWKHWRLSLKYGIQIPSKTKIGPGLYIGHGVGIVINGGTTIGSNCNISQFLSIGTNKNTPAIIGDNVYIGPNVCIVEDVKIGNNVKIGAGTIVIKDVPDNCTTVGNPNRVIIK